MTKELLCDDAVRQVCCVRDRGRRSVCCVHGPKSRHVERFIVLPFTAPARARPPSANLPGFPVKCIILAPPQLRAFVVISDATHSRAAGCPPSPPACAAAVQAAGTYGAYDAAGQDYKRPRY